MVVQRASGEGTCVRSTATRKSSCARNSARASCLWSWWSLPSSLQCEEGGWGGGGIMRLNRKEREVRD